MEILGRDRATREDDIAGGESSKGTTSEVHDDLNEILELRLSLELSLHFFGEEDEEAAELVGEAMGGELGRAAEEGQEAAAVAVAG